MTGSKKEKNKSCRLIYKGQDDRSRPIYSLEGDKDTCTRLVQDLSTKKDIVLEESKKKK